MPPTGKWAAVAEPGPGNWRCVCSEASYPVEEPPLPAPRRRAGSRQRRGEGRAPRRATARSGRARQGGRSSGQASAGPQTRTGRGRPRLGHRGRLVVLAANTHGNTASSSRLTRSPNTPATPSARRWCTTVPRTRGCCTAPTWASTSSASKAILRTRGSSNRPSPDGLRSHRTAAVWPPVHADRNGGRTDGEDQSALSAGQRGEAGAVERAAVRGGVREGVVDGVEAERPDPFGGEVQRA